MLGKYELSQITAADWASAIQHSTDIENFYAEVDQLDLSPEPNNANVDPPVHNENTQIEPVLEPFIDQITSSNLAIEMYVASQVYFLMGSMVYWQIMFTSNFISRIVDNIPRESILN